MNGDNKYLIPVSILIAGALIAWGVSVGNKNPTQTNNTQKNNKTEQKIELTPVTSVDHILGNPNADIKIVEYSDLECPFCKRFYETTKQIMNEYGKDGKVAIVFRHFPLDQLHSKSRKEAAATECAAKLGGNDKFWSYMDKIFTNTPSNNGLDLSQLPVYAEEIGLNKDNFVKCLKDDNKEMANKVEADYQKGVKAGVLGFPVGSGGTPYSLIITKDGKFKKIEGAQPYSTVKLLIDAALIGK